MSEEIKNTESGNTEINSTEMLLHDVARATERELLSVQSYKRYPVYQALLEIHPEGEFTVDGCMSKSALYIFRWIKEKTNVEEDRWPEGLKNLPDISEWKDYPVDENSVIFCADHNEPVRIRTLFWDNCLSIRFVENNSNFDGEFINNISLTRESDSVVLAIRTECRQLASSTQRAAALRPGYVSKIMMDDDMYLTEKLSTVSGNIGFEIRLTKELLPVSGNSSEAAELYKVMIDPLRNLPLLIIPEPADEEQKNSASLIYRDEGTDHHGVLGYYTAIYFKGGKWNKFIFSSDENQDIKRWIESVIEDGRALLIAPWDGSNGSFRFYTWDSEDEGGYVTWNNDTPVDECPKFDRDLVNRINKLKFSEEPLTRTCNFGNYRFNRELWSQFNENRIREAGESHNDEELIKSLEKKNESVEKDKRDLAEQVKSLRQMNEELREDRRRLNREKNDLEKAIKDRPEGADRSDSPQDYEKRLEALNARLKNGKTDPKALFALPNEWKQVALPLRAELLERIRNKYIEVYSRRKKTENPTRREDILGFLYLFNQNIGQNDAEEYSGLLDYPIGEELYADEFRNLVLDELWTDGDDFISAIASAAGYNKAWVDDLRRNMLATINNYRNISSIESTLKGIGLQLCGEGKHEKWALYGDERYTTTVACTPSDVNSGKNVVEDIIYRMF